MTDPLPTYPVRSARGVHITLEDGRVLVDGMSSWWAAVHGYRHPALDGAVVEQVEGSMSHVMFGGLTHRPAVELAARLLRLVNNDYGGGGSGNDGDDENDSDDPDSFWNGLDLEKMRNEYRLSKVFFSDSGSVSVEVALKMATQYWSSLGRPTKSKFISLRNGYHGDTFGAMSVCDPIGGMHSLFSGTLARQLFVPSPTGHRASDADETLREMEDALRRHSHEVAAVIMEPIVQGAGGMKLYHPRVLRRARELCDEYDVLLIFDEIATGFGRTGTMFAGWQGEGSYRPWSSLDDNEGRRRGDDDSDNVVADGQGDERDAESDDSIVYPDILCLGKALTGGYVTLGATLTTEKVSRGISDDGGVFMHGPTFMANPLACAVSLASVKLLVGSPWQQRARAVQRSLIEHMSPLADLDSKVREVRVLGAIGVCELREALDRDGMAAAQRRLVEEGVWLRPFGRLLYTMPPFNCDELDDGHVRRIGEAMRAVVEGL